MPVGRITQEAVNALTPGAKDIFYWDDRLPGFGLKVTPTGSKVYLLQYRMGGRGHKTKRYTIGKEGAFRAISWPRAGHDRLSVHRWKSRDRWVEVDTGSKE